MKTVRTALCAALALVCALSVFAGCAKDEAPAVSTYELSRSMLAALGSDENMLYVSGSDADAEGKFAYLSDMDYGKVEDFFLLYAENGKGNADEIAVIAVKTPRDAAEAEASLCTHLSKRETLYKSYDPSQLYKLENAVLDTVNGLSVLIVAENPAAVKAAFDAFLSENAAG